MDWILVCFLPHPENICHWRSSVTIKNIIFSETFYCFELESRFTQKTPPGGWKLFINIFYSARDREIWIDLGNLLLPPHRSSTAVVYLYVCRAPDIWIFVYMYFVYICIFVSVHTLHLGAEVGSKQETSPASPGQHSPAIKRLIFLRHETMCRRLMRSYTSSTYHSALRRLHI